jgi:iron(II)-dependent oxidoreductase
MTTLGPPITTELVADELDRARRASLDLLAPVPDADQRRQVSPLMSPLCWDLAHIAHYEELWLLRALEDTAPTDPRFDDLYDAFRHPRRERVDLPILDPAGARAFAADVRGRALARLDHVDLTSDEPLLRDAFVYGMVIQHEHQHDETMLATIQLMGEDFAHPDADVVDVGDDLETRGQLDHGARCTVPGGMAAIGTDADPWAYDNERPSHSVDLAPFAIDRYPVTNARFAEFVADGGYEEPRVWTEAGWAWRRDAGARHPQFWRSEGHGTWSRLRYGRREDLPLAEPVQHVCAHEAAAYARWSGGRLPTEPEWEAAAAGATTAGANLGRQGFAPSPVGSRPATASAHGVEQLLGDVWEWTTTPFTGYPGFRAFPYREYSEVFFGNEYTVLRGGSWATDPVAVRTTFRNWDFPIRRQIFAGFRCAYDV